DRILPLVREKVAGFTRAEIIARLEGTGIPFSPVSKPEELFDDPQLAAGGLETVFLDDGRETRLPTVPLEMAGRRTGAENHLPQPGRDAREVLGALGYGNEKIEQLIGAGAVGALLLLSRRMLMAGGAMLGATMALPGTAGAASIAREEGIPTDQAARIAITRRMRMRTDAGPVFWWFRGRNYAQQGANLIPMCDMIFGALMDVRPTADGGLVISQYELAFRTALDSGVRAEKLLNPITGTMVDVPFAPVGPTQVVYNADNVLHLPPTIGGSKFSVEHVPDLFFRIGDP
ncbi:hypothetical protein E4T56_gene15512, partial [Termitomyces sp. T112]